MLRPATRSPLLSLYSFSFPSENRSSSATESLLRSRQMFDTRFR